MAIRPLAIGDEAAWWEMRAALWSESDEAEIRAGVMEFRRGPQAAFVWDDGGGLAGFAEVSLRGYADGCTTSPVGYLEGWYVAPGRRRTGIGRALVEACEAWARERGCTEMASDALLAADVSRSAHAALGFVDVEHAVHFAKSLGATPSPEPAQATSGPEEAAVALRPVDEANVRAVCALEVAPHQRGFVARNAVSLAQAYTTSKAWPRAIYAGDIPVGFVMLYDDSETPEYVVWRFMIDGRHQGRGYGRAAMVLVEDYVRSRPGGTELTLTYVPAPGGPADFYRSCGYEDTGKDHDGELEMRKQL
jgi:GNAT superfamily N-acetyltransferase